MSTQHDVAILRPAVPEVEVVGKARRRRFTAEYKRKILREADACTAPGAIGALLRRRGWGAAGAKGTGGPHPKEAGARPKPKNPLAAG